MTQKLVGADDYTYGDAAWADYFYLDKFTAVVTGSMTQFYVRCYIAGNVKCALYADNAGEPGALITAMNTGQAVTAGWRALNFTATPVTGGTTYWLAVIMDTIGAVLGGTSGAVQRYKWVSYSGFTFPNPAGSGFNILTISNVVAGWGVKIIELTETVTFTDSLPKVVTKTITETSSFTDTLVKAKLKTLTEVVNFTDTLRRQVTKVLTEVVTFTSTMELRRWLSPTRVRSATRNQPATRTEVRTREET